MTISREALEEIRQHPEVCYMSKSPRELEFETQRSATISTPDLARRLDRIETLLAQLLKLWS